MSDYWMTKMGADPNNKSERAVIGIIDDLTDRRGLRQEFEEIDPDIQKEIFQKWVSVIDEPNDRVKALSDGELQTEYKHHWRRLTEITEGNPDEVYMRTNSLRSLWKEANRRGLQVTDIDKLRHVRLVDAEFTSDPQMDRLRKRLDEIEGEIRNPADYLGRPPTNDDVLSQIGQFIAPLYPRVAHALIKGREAIRIVEHVQRQNVSSIYSEE